MSQFSQILRQAAAQTMLHGQSHASSQAQKAQELRAAQQAEREAYLRAQQQRYKQQVLSHWPRSFPTLQVNADWLMREHQARDLEAFFHHFANTEINEYILVNRPRQLGETMIDVHYNRRLYTRKDGIFWSLVCKQTGQLAGTIGIYTNNVPLEICYDLAPRYWRRGIMTAALKTLLQFIRHQWPFMQEIRAILLRDNLASSGLLEKLGFTWLETSFNNRKHQGKWWDVEIYQLRLKRD